MQKTVNTKHVQLWHWPGGVHAKTNGDGVLVFVNLWSVFIFSMLHTISWQVRVWIDGMSYRMRVLSFGWNLMKPLFFDWIMFSHPLAVMCQNSGPLWSCVWTAMAYFPFRPLHMSTALCSEHNAWIFAQNFTINSIARFSKRRGFHPKMGCPVQPAVCNRCTSPRIKRFPWPPRLCLP